MLARIENLLSDTDLEAGKVAALRQFNLQGLDGNATVAAGADHVRRIGTPLPVKGFAAAAEFRGNAHPCIGIIRTPGVAQVIPATLLRGYGLRQPR